MKIIWFSEIKWRYLKTRKHPILSKFPETDEITRETWTKECFSHFGQMFFEFLCLPQILKEESKLLQIENEKVIKKAINDKKGVILLAIH